MILAHAKVEVVPLDLVVRQETPSLAVIRCSKRRFSCAKSVEVLRQAGHGEKYYPRWKNKTPEDHADVTPFSPLKD